jgi:hypothetical protein
LGGRDKPSAILEPVNASRRSGICSSALPASVKFYIPIQHDKTKATDGRHVAPTQGTKRTA